MSAPTMTIMRGETLVAWELSPVEALYFPGEPAPAHDPQDYKYVNGFVDVGDLPCRVATWREVATRTVDLVTDWPVESLILPGTNRRVDFSQFRHRPTRLSRWCRTHLSSPSDRYCSFRLSTRGGVHIWVDGLLAARFEPFTRNQDQFTVVHLPLRASGSEVVVLTEDMAERDTNWFFELALLDDVPLELKLPGTGRGQAGAQNAAETLASLASQVRAADDLVNEEGVVGLQFDTPAALDVTILVSITATSHTHAKMLERSLILPAGSVQLDICRGAELPDGYHSLLLVFMAGHSRIERTIAFTILRETRALPLPGDLAGRKRLALAHAAEHGEMRIGTVLALLETGANTDPRIRPIIEETLYAIEERRDCADFISVPLLWCLIRHGNALPDDLRIRSQRALLDFRYWVDEPGNDVMWYWSENHALCFHVSQLLAGQTWPDQHFSASGRSGNEQFALATDRLARWFDAVEADGLAEWNSAAYYPIDFIGLLALVELAPAEIAQRAVALSDRLFTMIALHTLEGVPAGSMGRAYDKELRAGPLTELAPFAAVAFGKGWLNNGVASLPLFAASTYEPPKELGRYVEPAMGDIITAQYLQGFGPAAHLNLYKTRHVQLSTNSAARAGGYGHQQHVLDLRLSGHPMARSWINHPGEDDPWGQGRPSYWAGNGCLPRVGQSDNAALLLYKLGDTSRLAFTHAYASRSGLTHHLGERALILQSKHALVAYLATGPLHAVDRGPSAGVDYRCDGRQTGWAAIVGGTADLDVFTRYIADCRLSLDDTATRLTLTRPDQGPLTLDWFDGLVGTTEVGPGEPKLTVHPHISIRTKSGH